MTATSPTVSNQQSGDAAARQATSEPSTSTKSHVARGAKVAIVYHFFAHYRGGIIEELIANSAYQFYFYGDDHDPAKVGIKAHEVSDPQRFVRIRSKHLLGPWLWQSGVLRLALQRDVQCIIFLGSPWYLSIWLAVILARLSGKRVLFWSHGWYNKDRGPRLWLKNALMRLAHGVMVYEHMSKCLAIAQGFAPERLYVVHNSLDYARQVAARSAVTPESLEKLRSSLFGDSSVPVVVYVGRILSSKRLDLLFDAAKLLHERQHAVNLLIVGDGPDRARVEQLAAESGLRVHFYGPCYDEEMLAKLIMCAHALVSPGSVGLNAIHCLTYGTPVITHGNLDDQKPEAEAVAPGITGELFQQNNAHDLARAIERWTSTGYSGEAHEVGQRLIDRFYTPKFQRAVIERAVSGKPANDLFWLYEADPNSAGKCSP